MDRSNFSDMNKTWLFDLDGTIFKHNGYKYGKDMILSGVKCFFERLPKDDVVIILTARSSEFKEETEEALKHNNIRYDYIIFDLPMGERIMFNDIKPMGMLTAFAYNLERDKGL